MWIPDCKIKNVEVAEFEDGLTLYAKISYTFTGMDGNARNYEIITKL